MASADPKPPPPAPRADRRPSSRVVRGVALEDDYAWLKADNWPEVLRDPARLPADIRRHLEAENAYTDAVLAPTLDLQSALIAEMRARIQEDDASVPAPDGPFAYFRRYREGGQHQLVCRVPTGGGAEEVLLDADAAAKAKPFFHLGGVRHSPDHALLAWGADETGSEFYEIRVRDLASGADRDAVPNAGGRVVWEQDGGAFLYVRLDPNHRPKTVMRHVLGTPPEADEVVYREAEEGWFVHLDETASGTFAIIGVSDHETSEAWLLDRADRSARPWRVLPRETGIRYEVEHRADALVILTNADGAEDFKIVTAPVRPQSSRRDWVDLVPHRPGLMILRLEVFRDDLVRLEREDARPRLVVRHLEDGAEHAVTFEEETFALGLERGYEFDTSIIRFVYSSMTTPAETYDFDMRDRTRTLVKRQAVPSGHDPAAYVTRRLLAPAPDGALVPVSILHARGLALDGSAPCLLYGYGAYGIAIPSAFDTKRLSLVDRGFVYAIAHVRGGTEKGWAWYEAGKRDRKTNTFHDFVAAGRALVAQGYTGPRRIVAEGRSAGGMLMGAVANLAPDLFAGILAEVPFVDVLNTMLDDTLPLTPPEWPEWGNPITDPDAFAAIRAYSPYDNIVAARLPAILAVGGLTDPRVTYWEPAKWVARLRERMTGGGPVLLRTEMEAGHGGASGRFDRLKEVGLTYAFAIAAVEGCLGRAERDTRPASA